MRDEMNRKGFMNTKEMNEKRQALSGGFLTVEAAVIVPCTVMMTALLLVLFFFVHNRNWYEMTAWECALTALNRTEAGQSGTENAVIHAGKRITDQPVPGTRPSVSVRADGGEADVSFWGQRFPMLQTGIFRYRTDVRLLLQRPAERIREAGSWKRKLFGDG
uniref:hypothetical protein n=1 Tax=Eubacterium cellulosolvens TaxID=29322 RepID=UPI000487ED8B|nr:hypothetical protein [[Eubacterium] cellulosolvens]